MVSKTSEIGIDIQLMLDLQITDRGVLVTLVGLKDITLPDTKTERRQSKSKQRVTAQPSLFGANLLTQVRPKSRATS
jgi:hypothetical protein